MAGFRLAETWGCLMKRARRAWLVPLVLAVVLLASGSAVYAQAQPEPVGRIVRIRKIDAGKTKTPEYNVRGASTMQRARDWLKILVQYETAPEWTDELDLTVYVVVKSREGGARYTLFRGSVTYVNIERGKHLADLYLHPSTLARYGDVERVGVVVGTQGRIVDMQSLPESNTRWWEQLPPVDGYVVNRMETPFAMLNFDDYEAIKGRGAGVPR